MFFSHKTRIIGLTTIDLGKIDNLDNIKNSISRKSSFESVSFLKRNPRFFNIEYCKPILCLKKHKDTEILNCDVNISKLSPDYQKKIKRFKQLINKSFFREETYLSSSGIACHFFLIEVNTNMETDEIITSTNILIKYDATLYLRNEFSFSIPSKINEIKTLFNGYIKEKRTNYVRKYSVIHLVSLPDEIIETAKGQAINLYKKFENEFHSLSVRTIEKWKDRYPENLPYEEKNASLSPLGILTINMRNSLFYEYPYDEIEVEDLYYAAIIEIRIWDMLVTAQLQYIQQILSRYEDVNYEEVSPVLIRKMQRNTLNTINEFDGFYLSTSKRVRNFYLNAYKVFHIKELMQLLLEKTNYLDEILNNIQNSSSQNKQREIISQQRDLLEQANESAEKDKAIKYLLNAISIIAGLILSFSIVVSFKLGKIWNLFFILIFGFIYTTFFFIIKQTSKIRILKTRRHLQVNIPFIKENVISNISKSANLEKIKDVFLTQDKISFIFKDEIQNTKSSNRVEISFNVADIIQNFNSTISIESTFKYKNKLPLVKDISNIVFNRILEILSLEKEIKIKEIRPLEIFYYER